LITSAGSDVVGWLDHFEVAVEFDFCIDDNKKDIQAVNRAMVLRDMVEGWQTGATSIR
jgi:hypothetical protein